MGTLQTLSRSQSALASASAADNVRHDDSRLSDSRTPVAHNHAGTDVTSGVIAIAAIPTGTTSTTVPFGNDTRFSDSRAPNGAAGGVLVGTYPNPTLKVSPWVPNTLTYAATVTPDATLGNSIKITATGALTINVPTGGVDGQNLVIEVLASGANRVVTLNASILLTTGQAATYTIVSAKVGFIALRYSVLAGNVWVCTSMTQML